MLPVVAASALASGSLLLHKHRQQHQRAKPQRRFKLHLTDNSDKPFQHFRRPEAATESSGAPGNDAEVAAQCDGQQLVTGPDNTALPASSGKPEASPSPAVAATASEQRHPYANEIQQLLANPRCPRFLTEQLLQIRLHQPLKQ